MRLSSAGISSRSMSHFNPRSPRGLRLKPCSTNSRFINFNPRSPRGLRHIRNTVLHLYGYFNPRSPNGLRLQFPVRVGNYFAISIHAARMGCDREQFEALPVEIRISIHAAQEGCDITARICCGGTWNFNPRSPRGLRPAVVIFRQNLHGISIHAAQEGCDYVLPVAKAKPISISIHAAQEGCDYKPNLTLAEACQISIHAAQEGCDRVFNHGAFFLFISIHAAQEGCDTLSSVFCRACHHFNPRSPRGLRLLKALLLTGMVQFQSTQPKRAATR